MTRNIVFNLFYWNIKKECFTTNMDLDIKLDYHQDKNYITFECFINNETIEKQEREFPKKVVSYEKYYD